MDLIEIGKIIKEARISKNLTQRELANSLFVTDKAVSKWERGLSSPDNSLLVKLSGILDLDVEKIVSNDLIAHKQFKGVLYINDKNDLYLKNINQMPLIFNQLAIFSLLRIKNIEIFCKDESYICNLHLENYGFNVFINKHHAETCSVEISDNIFLFGANLTRHLEYMINCNQNIQCYYLDQQIPLRIFCNKNDEFVKKTFGRGYIFFIFNSNQFSNQTKLINLLNKFNSFKINELCTIDRNRH